MIFNLCIHFEDIPDRYLLLQQTMERDLMILWYIPRGVKASSGYGSFLLSTKLQTNTYQMVALTIAWVFSLPIKMLCGSWSIIHKIACCSQWVQMHLSNSGNNLIWIPREWLSKVLNNAPIIHSWAHLSKRESLECRKYQRVRPG